MNVWPVLAREVRQAARQPMTYRVRWAAAASFLLIMVGLAFRGILTPDHGVEVFGVFHLALFVSTWVLVPLLTADCLSRERREGTLGLLFLTPLRSLDIVVAKLVAHSLRGLTVWMAVIPILTIPLLMGGVGWQKILFAAMQDTTALLLALTSGIVVSAWSQRWAKAVARSLLLSFLLCLGFVFLQGWAAYPWMAPTRSTFAWGDLPIFSAYSFWLGINAITGSPDLMGSLYLPPLRGTGGPLPALALVEGGLFVLAGVVILFLGTAFAAWKTRRSWQVESPSELLQALERRLTTPILGKVMLGNWLRTTLSRNPVGWLELRTWTGRMILFGWVAVIIGVFIGMLGQLDFWTRWFGHRGVDLVPWVIAWPLVASMAASATGSFRRERETGMLELLLVSPMSARSIVWGRLRALYAQFLPAVLLVIGAWLFMMTFPDQDRHWGRLFTFIIWSISAPCIGLYCSLRFLNFLSGLLAALAGVWIIPAVASIIVGFSIRMLTQPTGPIRNYSDPSFTLEFTCLVLAGLCVWRMINRLEQRRFDFNQEVT